MEFKHTEVFNLEGALRGMRNPLESWDKSDSQYQIDNEEYNFVMDDVWCDYNIGKNDMKLARSLVKAGSDHRKFLRQIMVCVDINAPLYWFKEFDTYKTGTTSNSTSTMHKLGSRELTYDDFEWDDFDESRESMLEYLNNLINIRRQLLVLRSMDAKNKADILWRRLIQDLPCSFKQTRTVTMSYENVLAMYNARHTHKLTEWSVDFVNWVECLPYFKAMCIDDRKV